MQKQIPTLAYWKPRGLGCAIRLMLNHLNVEFEDKTYKYGKEPNFYTEGEWIDAKPNLGLDFPNLPYYIDGDFKFTESLAIMKYIARENGSLTPSTNRGWAKAEMLETIVRNFLGDFAESVCLVPKSEFEEAKANYFEAFPLKIKNFEAYLSKNKWLAGDELTYVDFCFGEVLNWIKLLKGDFCLEFPNTVEYAKRFENIDSVVSYRNKASYKALPIGPPSAAWGGNSD